jgi:hypothetical protein
MWMNGKAKGKGGHLHATGALEEWRYSSTSQEIWILTTLLQGHQFKTSSCSQNCEHVKNA